MRGGAGLFLMFRIWALSVCDGTGEYFIGRGARFRTHISFASVIRTIGRRRGSMGGRCEGSQVAPVDAFTAGNAIDASIWICTILFSLKLVPRPEPIKAGFGVIVASGASRGSFVPGKCRKLFEHMASHGSGHRGQADYRRLFV